MEIQEEYYSINEICRNFKISQSTVYKMIKDKKIHAIKFLKKNFSKCYMSTFNYIFLTRFSSSPHPPPPYLFERIKASNDIN